MNGDATINVRIADHAEVKAALESAAAEINRLREMTCEHIADAHLVLHEQVGRVRALHAEIPEGKPDAGFCEGCEDSWPCRTIRALDGQR